MKLPKSKLTKKQTIIKEASWIENGNGYKMVTEIRHDDCCGNGHNSFAITCDIRENGREYMGGSCHDEIAEKMPELKPFLKWHCCSTDGPMHYIANTIYHASSVTAANPAICHEPDLEAARNTAIWPDATLEQLQDKEALMARLPQLMEDFKNDVESLGLIY